MKTVVNVNGFDIIVISSIMDEEVVRQDDDELGSMSRCPDDVLSVIFDSLDIDVRRPIFLACRRFRGLRKRSHVVLLRHDDGWQDYVSDREKFRHVKSIVMSDDLFRGSKENVSVLAAAIRESPDTMKKFDVIFVDGCFRRFFSEVSLVFREGSIKTLSMPKATLSHDDMKVISSLRPEAVDCSSFQFFINPPHFPPFEVVEPLTTKSLFGGKLRALDFVLVTDSFMSGLRVYYTYDGPEHLQKRFHDVFASGGVPTFSSMGLRLQRIPMMTKRMVSDVLETNVSSVFMDDCVGLGMQGNFLKEQRVLEDIVHTGSVSRKDLDTVLEIVGRLMMTQIPPRDHDENGGRLDFSETDDDERRLTRRRLRIVYEKMSFIDALLVTGMFSLFSRRVELTIEFTDDLLENFERHSRGIESMSRNSVRQRVGEIFGALVCPA